MARSITGIVSSKAGDKSIVITVATSKIHPIYRKRYTRSSKFMAHDEKNQAHVGDKVVITETRPLSARKRFNLESIVAKASVQFRDEDAMAGVPVEEAKAEVPVVAEAQATKPKVQAKPEQESK